MKITNQITLLALDTASIEGVVERKRGRKILLQTIPLYELVLDSRNTDQQNIPQRLAQTKLTLPVQHVSYRAKEKNIFHGQARSEVKL